MPDEGSRLPVAYGSTDLSFGTPSSLSAAPSSYPLTTPLTIEVDGMEITIAIASDDKPRVRQRFKEMVRKEKRRAADAGNAANTAQQIGVGIGGALAVAGGVAIVTAAAPVVLAAAVATGLGAAIAAAGLIIGHRMNARKFAHEEKVDRYQDAVEELR